MSNHRNKNKNKKKLIPNSPSAPLPVAPQPMHDGATEVDKRQDRRITWTQLGTAASVALNVFLAILGYQSAKSAARSADEAAAANKIAQAAQDRAAGKIKATFEFVDDRKTRPDRDKEFMRKKDGFDQFVFRIENVDELMRWSPYVWIKNTGSEPIDAIKTDVRHDFGGAYGVGVYQIDPPPIAMNETSTFEASAFGKLDPGRTARIYVAPLLLNQMTRGDMKEFPDRDRIGVFSVNVYCRLVGASSYDRVTDGQTVVFTFHWRPAGFKPDAKNVKELLEKKPWVTID